MQLTREAATAWLVAYHRAWASDDPDDIRALFTDDAMYSTGPFDEPWHGIETIVRNWIERGDSSLNVDGDLQVVAVDDDLAVIEGRTRYHDNRAGPNTEYANVWFVRLDDDGRAREFREIWVERPG